ncbi:MAG TPA: hypothetical protein VHW90_01610 [Stellaceae bacterium]|jgi:hypothetical protein|nr:hypothetical protein [Stellaceae bacterium]
MRRGRKWFWLICGLLALCCPTILQAAPCDEFNPASPVRTTRITLNSNDAADPGREELRSFIATGSTGKVNVAVVSAVPSNSVRAISAVPEVSRLSSRYGEGLPGVAVSILLWHTNKPATVVLDLRQVCAQYFRDTFLYY